MHAPQGPWVPLTQPHPRALQEHPLPTPGHHFLSQGMHPLPGPLRPLPETLSSTPQTQLGGRGQECGSPETTPCLEGPGTLDCLSPYKVLAPAPSDPTCRVSPLGRCPRPLCPDPRRTPGLDTVSLHCPHADRALRPGVPASMRSESPVPHPWQTTRSKVTGRPLGTVLSEPWVTQGKVPRFPPGRRGPPQDGGRALPAASQADSHPGRAAAAARTARSSSGGGGGMVGGRRGGRAGAVMWHSGRGAAARRPPPASAESGYSAAQKLRGDAGGRARSARSPLPPAQCPAPGRAPLRAQFLHSHLSRLER